MATHRYSLRIVPAAVAPAVVVQVVVQVQEWVQVEVLVPPAAVDYVVRNARYCMDECL